MFAGTNVILSQHNCLLYRLVVISGFPHIHRLFLSVGCKLLCFGVCQAIAFGVSFIFYRILIEVSSRRSSFNRFLSRISRSTWPPTRSTRPPSN